MHLVSDYISIFFSRIVCPSKLEITTDTSRPRDPTLFGPSVYTSQQQTYKRIISIPTSTIEPNVFFSSYFLSIPVIINMPASDNPCPISAADDVWHQNKAQIRDLYQNQRKTLKYVKHLMEANGFPVKP